MLFRQLFDRETSTYTYLIADKKTREAVIIDPVRDQLNRDLKLIRDLNLTLRYTLETHIHADHITSAGPLRDWTGALTAVSIHADVACASQKLRDGDIIRIGSHQLRVIETPGHTHTCLSYLLDGRMVFTGDALLIRGTGRTDFQSGDARQLYHSITEKLFTLDNEVLVYPAHDYRGHTCSTIGEEKRFNPRLAGKSIEEFVVIMDNLNLPEPKHIREALPGNLNCGQEFEPRLPGQDHLEVTSDWLLGHRDRVLLVDVRRPEEWAESLGFIEGAMCMPLALLDKHLFDLPREQVIVTVCRGGVRSLAATERLRGYGYPKVWSLKGGMEGWRQAELPTQHMKKAEVPS
ncbi:MBL fold metallo-hydrolase [Sulfidibacter corallicola]|uniref:MBL fold metallo-hydrolase n=1 Tax=Sulfidibacter corallicola TaxID=2818388 RepID=A0A8A4TV56_SULCO|nr:MBL fold metallo-hydrolase [Sulfidibacter corallicola]QTD53410.1 MBL fold metallo-hydrolase [Sulfidibacter corallicola]